MKNKLPLVLGGLAGVLVPVLLIGLYAASGPSEPAPSADAQTVVPVPAPALDHELATVTVPPRPEAAPPAPAPEPVVEVDPYAPELRERGDLRVRRLIVASGVSRHEPTGAADAFRLNGQDRLYAFVEAVNASGQEVALDVTFEPPTGESAGHVALDVPARVRRWRTWAFTRHVYETGRWQAVVRGPDGRVLARRAFDIER